MTSELETVSEDDERIAACLIPNRDPKDDYTVQDAYRSTV